MTRTVRAAAFPREGLAPSLRGARPLAEPHGFLGSVRAARVADPEGNPVEPVTRRNG